MLFPVFCVKPNSVPHYSSFQTSFVLPGRCLYAWQCACSVLRGRGLFLSPWSHTNSFATEAQGVNHTNRCLYCPRSQHCQQAVSLLSVHTFSRLWGNHVHRLKLGVFNKHSLARRRKCKKRRKRHLFFLLNMPFFIHCLQNKITVAQYPMSPILCQHTVRSKMVHFQRQ